MRSFFDTSALVPIFIDQHIHHEASLKAYLKADKKHDCCAAHSLAEVYSTLTRLPPSHRASADQAMFFLEDMAQRLTFIALDAEEYWEAIANAAESGVVGGLTYDALLARCALKAKVETIYTWNIGHFQQLGTQIARLIKTP
ncbi:MAG: PIN domain-containing protein [Terriglobales bacterium]